MDGIIRTYDQAYKQIGQHRRRCRACGKLIQDGEMTRFTLYRKEKYYPVKGIMIFNTWSYIHVECTVPTK